MAAESNLISVLIASKTGLAGELFAGALNRQPRFRVATSVTTAEEVLQAAKSVDLDVALISAALADGPLSGFVALRHLRDSAPATKAVLLLDSLEPNLVFEAFRAGVKGVFCPSQSPFKALCRCVDRIHAGQIWASSSQLAYVLEMFAKLAPMRVVDAGGVPLLTKREEDVVRLLAEGLQNREIADELSLSEHTIKNYLFHIYDKLGVSSRVELVLYALSNNRTQSGGLKIDEKLGVRAEPGENPALFP